MADYTVGLAVAANAVNLSRGSVGLEAKIDWRYALLDISKVNNGAGVIASDNIDFAKLAPGEVMLGIGSSKVLVPFSGPSVTAATGTLKARIGAVDCNLGSAIEFTSGAAAGTHRPLTNASLTAIAPADSGGTLRLTVGTVTGGTTITAGKVLVMYAVLKTPLVADALLIDADGPLA